jgi:hypothetical protein
MCFSFTYFITLSKVTQHLLNNNILPKKLLLKPQKKYATKKRLTFKRGVNQPSNDDNFDSEYSKVTNLGKKSDSAKNLRIEESSDSDEMLEEIL